MIRILVSSTELSASKIGSWTQRIASFTSKRIDFFNFYLGPTKTVDEKYIFCKKRPINRLSNLFPHFSQPLFRTANYLKEFKRIYKPTEKIQVVVMDDIMLLAGFAQLKPMGFDFELVYSYHGHSFKTTGNWLNQVDKVLFLTELGYHQTKSNHQEFTPEVFIIGNGVDSKKYYPINAGDKKLAKINKGFLSDDIVITWLSNDRPKKGLQLFLKLIPRLVQKYPNLKVQVIGNSQPIPHFGSRVSAIGRVPNDDLPIYLQLSDLYCFTSLWEEGFGLTLAEAAKCGNLVIASENGGIPEVVNGQSFSFLVSSPNVLSQWEIQIENAMKTLNSYTPDPIFLASYHSLEDWENKFLYALES